MNDSTGEPSAEGMDMSQSGGGGMNMGLGEGLEYSGDGSGAGGGQYGSNWVNPNQQKLTFDGGNVYLESGPTETVAFLPSGSGYTAMYFVRDVLTYDGQAKEYTVTSPNGRRRIFSEDGVLERMDDAAGNSADYDYDTSGKLESAVTGTGTDRVGYFYAYIPNSDPHNSGKLESTTMRVGGITASSNYRRLVYSYTDAGQMKQVVLDEFTGGAWEEIETKYFRYHATGKKKLRFVLGDAACKQLQAEIPAGPDAATPAQLARYADAHYAAYDGKGRVKTLKTNGGKYTYGFTYATSQHAPSSTNVWTSKTTVSMPDGSTEASYFNSSLNLLLKQVAESQAAGGKVWYPVCQRFDNKSRIVLSASSSAVATVNESSPTLVTLKPNDGLIRVFEYYSYGNIKIEGLKKGENGSVVKQREFTYEARTVGGVTIYKQKTVTEYREATASGASSPVTTSYSYTWHNNGTVGTFQVETMTTTLPAVPNSENGDNQAGATNVTYDQYGFLREEVDAVGTKTTHDYYLQSGALKQTIQDAGTGRLNLTTDYEVDPLGRTILVKGPVHSISLNGVETSIRRAQWTQYLDSADEVRTIEGYIKTAGGTEHAINPVTIRRSFRADPEVPGGRIEESISAVFSGSGVPLPSQTYPRSAYVRWSTQHFDRHNQQTHSRVYHDIPSSGAGTNGTNYAQTSYGYDAAGRQNQTTSPEGTIHWTQFNAMGWAVETRVGTNATNQFVITANQYDLGVAGGDGNVTKVTTPVDGTPGNDRKTLFRYDWRNRQTETETDDGTPRVIISVRTYDNRDNVTQADEYQTSIAPANLINRANSYFDTRNRQYRTERRGVDIASGGTLKPALTSNSYYDQAGRVLRDAPAGMSAFNVTHYDALGRAAKQFLAHGGTLNLSNPGNISGTTVVEQSEVAYDGAGNAISTTTRQRFDDATGPGELKTPTTQPTARVSYSASYPDGIGRTAAAVNFGTNGGAAWSRPPVIPNRGPGEPALISGFQFNAAGDQTESSNPMGTVTKHEFDDAGRRTKLIENYQDNDPPVSDPDKNKTTKFEYNLDGSLKKLIAENPTTGEQVTEWIYGVTMGQGSQINSKSLVYQKVYPDASGAGDRVTFTYNRQGQPVGMTDQAAIVHAYAYDKFGRLLSDTASNFGSSGIDDTVRKITRSYEVRGMLEVVSSFGTGATPLNQVRLAYNAYSQLAKDYQSHNGAVNPSTTLRVGYDYADGSANTVRPTGITYPDGTTALTIAYGGTAADALSRPDALKEGSTTLCSYRYLGAGVVIGVNYNAASNLELTFEDGGTGGAGDKYTGLDRFGRLVETLWKKGSDKPVRSKYGRNEFGGVVWRRDEEAHRQGVSTADNYYWYDGLYQVKERQRGNLTGTPPYTGITAPSSQQENWTYDATGNWAAYADTNPANSQTRTHNKANEITQIASPTVAPGYDPAGNILTLPRNPGGSTAQYALKWDAWNRLVSVQDGSTPIASYTYDGLTRRLTKTVPVSGGPDEVRHYYYNAQWRALEERVEGASTAVDRQYTWGLRDRWDMLRRKRSVGGGSLNETHYVLRDYLDPVAVADPAGNIVERYAYDAFGKVRFLEPDFSARDASVYDWEFLFHAEFLDPDTKLYNYGYRYYDTALGRWPNRDPIGERGGMNLYGFVGNDPNGKFDRLGLDVINTSDLPAWVYISGTGPGTGWIVINSGATVKGDTDMICPNVTGAAKAPDGKYRCLKIIDCYDATISGKAPGPYSITPVYAGATAGRGNNFARKCCCAIPRCASSEQSKKGGSVDPLTVAPSLPPNYPP